MFPAKFLNYSLHVNPICVAFLYSRNIFFSIDSGLLCIIAFDASFKAHRSGDTREMILTN